MMNMTSVFPGFSPKAPPAPKPLPPLPTRADPAVAAAKTKLRLSSQKRRGPQKSILTQLGSSNDSGVIKRQAAVLGA